MNNQAQKEAITAALAESMKDGHITMITDADGCTRASLDHIAESRVIDANYPFCDISAFTENALDSLSGNQDVIEALTERYGDRDYKKATLMMAIDAFVDSCILEDALQDTFSPNELQAIWAKHPEAGRIKRVDHTTDFYNAGETGFTA